MKTSYKTVGLAFFEHIEDCKWQWKSCKQMRIKGECAGWTILYSHVASEHADIIDSVIQQQHWNTDNLSHRSMLSFLRNIVRWIEWLVMENSLSNFIEKPKKNQFSNVTPIGRKTSMKYIDVVNQKLREVIKIRLPETFGVIFHGWSVESEHYTAIFASWSSLHRSRSS